MRPLLLQQLLEPCHSYLYPIEKYETSAHAVPRTDMFQFLMSKISRLSSLIYPVVSDTSLLRELKLSGLRFEYPNTLPPPSPRIEENTPCLLARIEGVVSFGFIPGGFLPPSAPLDHNVPLLHSSPWKALHACALVLRHSCRIPAPARMFFATLTAPSRHWTTLQTRHVLSLGNRPIAYKEFLVSLFDGPLLCGMCF